MSGILHQPSLYRCWGHGPGYLSVPPFTSLHGYGGGYGTAVPTGASALGEGGWQETVDRSVSGMDLLYPVALPLRQIMALLWQMARWELTFDALADVGDTLGTYGHYQYFINPSGVSMDVYSSFSSGADSLDVHSLTGSYATPNGSFVHGEVQSDLFPTAGYITYLKEQADLTRKQIGLYRTQILLDPDGDPFTTHYGDPLADQGLYFHSRSGPEWESHTYPPWCWAIGTWGSTTMEAHLDLDFDGALARDSLLSNGTGTGSWYPRIGLSGTFEAGGGIEYGGPGGDAYSLGAGGDFSLNPASGNEVGAYIVTLDGTQIFSLPIYMGADPAEVSVNVTLAGFSS